MEMEEVYKLMYTCETLYGSDIMPLMLPYTSIAYHKYYVEQTRKNTPASQSGFRNAIKNTVKGVWDAVTGINEGYK